MQIVARLDDLECLFGPLLGGADVIDDDHAEFLALDALQGDDLLKALLDDYIAPTYDGLSEEVRANVATSLAYFVDHPPGDDKLEALAASLLLPVDLPVPPAAFFRLVRDRFVPPGSRPAPDRVLV